MTIAVIQFLAGFACGFTLWAASVLITGEVEPWDAAVPYHAGGILIASFFLTLLRPRSCWAGILGLYLGQVCYMEWLYNPSTAHIFPAWIGAALFSAQPAGLGVIAGIVVRQAIR